MTGNTSRVTGLCSVLFSRNVVCSMDTYDSCNCDLSTRRRLVGSWIFGQDRGLSQKDDTVFDSILVGFKAWVKLPKHLSVEYLFRFIRLRRGKEFEVQMFAINLFYCFSLCFFTYLVFMRRHGWLWFVSLIIDCQYKISQITCFQITNTAKQPVFLGEKAKKGFFFLEKVVLYSGKSLNEHRSQSLVGILFLILFSYVPLATLLSFTET